MNNYIFLISEWHRRIPGATLGRSTFVSFYTGISGDETLSCSTNAQTSRIVSCGLFWNRKNIIIQLQNEVDGVFMCQTPITTVCALVM